MPGDVGCQVWIILYRDAIIYARFVMRKLWIALIVLGTCIAGSIHAQSSVWTPDTLLISKLEATIQPGDFPKWGYVGHPPIATDYVRYYTGTMTHGHRMISGEWVLLHITDKKRAGIYVVRSEKDFPIVYDGSCGIVHVVYSVETGHLVSLTCNGRA